MPQRELAKLCFAGIYYKRAVRVAGWRSFAAKTGSLLHGVAMPDRACGWQAVALTE
jgi:hypothetical protein